MPPIKPAKIEDCTVALVYDRVTTTHGGAEKVLLALHELFPKAKLYTTVYDPQQAGWAKVFTVVPSFLQKLPFAHKMHRWLAVLAPLAFESFDFSGANIIISITSAEAKGIITQPHQLHLCYLLTPTRYLYSHYDDYLHNDQQLKLPGLRWLASQGLRYLRHWDQVASSRPDAYLPISKLIAERTQTYYHRQALAPLYPPVEPAPLATHRSRHIPANFTHYLLVVSRLVSYKRIDLAIQACQQLNYPLIIVGDGPEKTHLKQLANTNNRFNTPILFLEKLPNSEVASLMHHADALLMPGIEDFGITALESLAQNTPVIVHHQSGVAELITDQATGLHLQDLTVSGLMKAIKALTHCSFSQSKMNKTVQSYQTKHFQSAFIQVLTRLWKEFYVTTS